MQALGEDYAEQIGLTAVSTPHPSSFKSEVVDYLRGNITLDELKANARYKVFLDVLTTETITDIYDGFVETPPLVSWQV